MAFQTSPVLKQAQCPSLRCNVSLAPRSKVAGQSIFQASRPLDARTRRCNSLLVKASQETKEAEDMKKVWPGKIFCLRISLSISPFVLIRTVHAFRSNSIWMRLNLLITSNLPENFETSSIRYRAAVCKFGTASGGRHLWVQAFC